MEEMGETSPGVLSRSALPEMLGMQADMNAKVNPAWLTAGYPYLRAVMVEGAEALDHAGWKWWKAQEPDIVQLRMELVDIWHFAMSDALVGVDGDTEEAADWLRCDLTDLDQGPLKFDGFEYYLSDMGMLSRIELLIGLAASKVFDTNIFGTLLADCGMTWDDLYRLYTGKHVLNFFRQDNGYKDGTYQKVWGGREDNEHLTEILGELDPSAPDFRENVYRALSGRYLSERYDAHPH